MFEEYLQDSFKFLELATAYANKGQDRDARRYYRASVFYSAGAIEAFLNYIAESFAEGKSLENYEIAYLNDQVLIFTPDKGINPRPEYHPVAEKTKLLLRRFGNDFDFRGTIWSDFADFKNFRDSLVHPHKAEDELPASEYQRRVTKGLRAIILVMDSLSNSLFHEPLRKQLLDLIPE